MHAEDMRASARRASARRAPAMVLLSGFYVDPDPGRTAELVEALRRNAVNGRIEEIHVFCEQRGDPGRLAAAYPPLASPKVRLVPHGRRVAYRDLFAHARARLAGRQVAIANADIWFDATLARLDGADLDRRLLCLSRWEPEPGGARLFEHPYSQDAWIFRAPLPEFPCDFPLGVPACDNRLAYEAAAAGLRVSNPARSIRAHHLHRSGVRRYAARDRLAGPTLGVPASFLGTPWIWYVVASRGDMAFRYPGELAAQPRASCVAVIAEPEAAASPGALPPDVRVVRPDPARRPGGAGARNAGAAAADGDAVLCFLDPDVSPAPGLSRELLQRFDPGAFLVPDGAGPRLDSALVCAREAFDCAGGFDEAFRGFGEEVLELRDRLEERGLERRTFPASLLQAGSVASAIPDEAVLDVHRAYRRALAAVRGEAGGLQLPAAARAAIHDGIALARRRARVRAAAPGPAAIAFREEMGYRVAPFAPGTSSHVNDARPIERVPRPLAGLVCTQVVAGSAAPVEVEFLAPGTLYVLVGTDWEGHRVASRWLEEAGAREPLPPVRTARGTAFEVWSLAGEAGDRWVVPTQVMLVAASLERR